MIQYLDFDLEVGAGSGDMYPIVAKCDSVGTATISMRFPFDSMALKDHLKDLRIALLRSGGRRRKLLSREEQVVQEFGRSLFDALFAGNVRSLYDAGRREAVCRGLGLRLRLCIQAPELAALPWEYLYDVRQESYLCLSKQTPLVRYLNLSQSTQALSVTPPLRILGMVASPSDQDALDQQPEQRRVREALKDLIEKRLVELTWLTGQTWRDLQRVLRRDGPWHVFHFIGHGGFDERRQEGVIAFATEEGKTDPLSATQVGTLLADHSSLKLVVLNACQGATSDMSDLFSSTAATLARRGIPAVLAMQEEITDRSALELTRSFYEALADGLSVDAAVADARQAINLGGSNSLEWGTPVLYLRASVGVLFDLTEQSSSMTPQSSSQIARLGLSVPLPRASQGGAPLPFIPPDPQIELAMRDERSLLAAAPIDADWSTTEASVFEDTVAPVADGNQKALLSDMNRKAPKEDTQDQELASLIDLAPVSSGKKAQGKLAASTGTRDFIEISSSNRIQTANWAGLQDLQLFETIRAIKRFADWFTFTDEKWHAIHDSQLGWKPLRRRWKSWEEIYHESFASRSADPIVAEAVKAAEGWTCQRFKVARDCGATASAIVCFLHDLDTLRQVVSLFDVPHNVTPQRFAKSPIFHDWLVFTDEKWGTISDATLGWKSLRGRWRSWDEIYKESFASHSADPIVMEAAKVAEEHTSRRFAAARDRGSAASAVACFLCDLHMLFQMIILLDMPEKAGLHLLQSHLLARLHVQKVPLHG